MRKVDHQCIIAVVTSTYVIHLLKSNLMTHIHTPPSCTTGLQQQYWLALQQYEETVKDNIIRHTGHLL